MKKLFGLLTTAVLVAWVLPACNDGETPHAGHRLTLLADKTEIYANGTDEVRFTVTLDGEDVTANAMVCIVDAVCLTEPVFSTETAGSYSFYATYDSDGEICKSDEIAVTANKYAELAIRPSRTKLMNDGKDAATFTVSFGKDDVTAGAELFLDGEPFAGNTFSSTTEGEYRFHAAYTDDTFGDVQSAPVAISVVDAAYDPVLTIKKNVAYFNWTATWCGPCYMYKVDMKDFLEEHADNVIQINIHAVMDDKIGGHRSLVDINSQLSDDGRFVSSGRPYAVADLREALISGIGTIQPEDIQRVYDACIGNLPKTAVMVNSSVSADAINVTVNVGAKEVGDYSIGIFLVEDHIEEEQNGHNGLYDHTNVVRQMGTESIFGQPLTTMTAGQTIAAEFSFEHLPKYNADNLHLFIYTLCEDNGHMIVDNAVKVPANQLTEYNYTE